MSGVMVVVEEEIPGRRNVALFQSAVPSFCKIVESETEQPRLAQPTIQPLPLRCRGRENLRSGGIRFVADRK